MAKCSWATLPGDHSPSDTKGWVHQRWACLACDRKLRPWQGFLNKDEVAYLPSQMNHMSSEGPGAGPGFSVKNHSLSTGEWAMIRAPNPYSKKHGWHDFSPTMYSRQVKNRHPNQPNKILKSSHRQRLPSFQQCYILVYLNVSQGKYVRKHSHRINIFKPAVSQGFSTKIITLILEQWIFGNT